MKFQIFFGSFDCYKKSTRKKNAKHARIKINKKKNNNKNVNRGSRICVFFIFASDTKKEQQLLFTARMPFTNVIFKLTVDCGVQSSFDHQIVQL